MITIRKGPRLAPGLTYRVRKSTEGIILHDSHTDPLDSALAGRPVEVRSDRGPSMDWLISKASAAGL